MSSNTLEKQYQDLMISYLHGKEEKKLYAAHQLSKTMLEQKVAPEELVSYHVAAMHAFSNKIPQFVSDSFDFLLEVIIGYGIAYREHLSLRTKQQQLVSELEVAASMQQTLLPSEPPHIKGLDIGIISMAANQMGGDYYNFVDHGNQRFGIALADIIGKGIPAALCMSMIKYAMESFYDHHLMPQSMLQQLNRVVERNVDPSMFITMVYGIYDVRRHHFTYAGAGHEPGLFYDGYRGEFRDLETKGLVLGVSRNVEHPEYCVALKPGDAVILFSDGVTERRIEGKLLELERSQLRKLLHKHIDKRAQQLVEEIYTECLQLANFDQHDDHTMIVIRRIK